MSERRGSVRTALLFVVIAIITGAAAMPFLGFTGQQSTAAEEEPAKVELLPDDEPELTTEPQPTVKIAKEKPAAPRKRKTWYGGGDVVVGGKSSNRSTGGGSGSRSTASSGVPKSGGHTSGDSGKTWHCPRCNKVVGSGDAPPAKVACCDTTYVNGKQYRWH